ncbi:hypothetical protein TOPH_02966 [Tolypocladium ophioglossoides CBS 100239]|uniref:Aminoglycoside phosphotransferase domain-containing protein n=1 Tax=Tolypocladium ophioglossoides (strain CBS 100239) TaxID=1163406 RepID=A0A0L0NFB2_TOLOC|nr:hypothetical protein TOPH_02966 [Tolypocladium ophioglossoides CBS 100239]
MPEASTPGSSTAMDNVASPVAHVHLDNSRVPKMPQPTPAPRHSHSIYRHARFNLAQLLELSKGLRNRPCVCDESQVPMFGAFSWAIILKFDDDVEWIFRSPRTDHVEISRDTSCRVLASEAATLRYLRQHTSIPVPDVHDFWHPAYPCRHFAGKRLAIIEPGRAGLKIQVELLPKTKEVK